MSVEEQAVQARTFLEKMVSALGVEATTSCAVLEDAIELSIDGPELGFLIGPRGTTLAALQDLTRTAVQRRGEERGTRITVDVSGFRARRAVALAAFAHQVAQEVLASGEPRALEIMSPADRKTVHDALTSVAGVSTSSAGVEPRRYVVISPDPAPEQH
jgi:spoIIIJ-associated protein